MKSVRTIAFFLIAGLIFGVIPLSMAVMLTYPGFTPGYVLNWNALIGAVFGALAGMMAAASDFLFQPESLQIQGYRRKLAAGIGTFTGFSAALITLVVFNGFLWGTNVLALALISGLAGLAGAYTAARHVDCAIDLEVTATRFDDIHVVWRIAYAAANRSTFILGTAAGILYNVYQRIRDPYYYAGFSPLSLILAGAAGGLLIMFLNLVLLGLLNGCLLLFVNRLYFKEYAPHLTREQYKSRVAVLCFGVTLGASPLFSTFAFAPLVAFIAAIAARSYADWLYTDPEKARRSAKEKHVPARLLETESSPNTSLIEDEPVESIKRER